MTHIFDPSSRPLDVQASTLADKLPNLMLEAERIAANISFGLHGRTKRGPGDSFWQYRPYQPGEATRRIDWRQSAKTDHLFVREREWEAPQSIWLWCDTSPSMAFKSNKTLPLKQDRAALLLLACGHLLSKNGEHIASLGASERPAGGQMALQRIYQHLKNTQRHDLPPKQPLPRFGELVLISDFLSPLDDLRARLKQFSRRNLRGHLVQILDPAEETLPFSGRVRFNGLEGERSTLINDVDGLRSQYTALLSERRAALMETARSLGWSFHCHHTDKSPQTALLALYHAFSTRGRRT